MTVQHVTLVVNPLPSKSSAVYDRFFQPASLKPHLHHHPERPAYTGGSNHYNILYNLSRPQERLGPLTDIQPHHWRELREANAQARQQNRQIHYFAVVDSLSPYGTRKIVEPVLRHYSADNKPVIHLVDWHSVASEQNHAESEFRSFKTAPRSQPRFEDFHNNVSLERYIATELLGGDELPFVVILNHQFHGWDKFEHGLREFEIPVISLAIDLPGLQRLRHDQSKYRGWGVMTTNQKYADSYLGTSRNYPYLEEYTHRSSTELLEMLLSPHFSFEFQPHELVLLLDEEPSKDFYALLNHSLKSFASTDYDYYVLQPGNIHGNFHVSSRGGVCI